jgi:hypothetical protein
MLNEIFKGGVQRSHLTLYAQIYFILKSSSTSLIIQVNSSLSRGSELFAQKFYRSLGGIAWGEDFSDAFT